MTLTDHEAGRDVVADTDLTDPDLTDPDLTDSDLTDTDLADLTDPERAETDPDGDGLGPASSVVLFEGDEGRLELGQRKTLVALLKHRFITARNHPAEWRALVADPELVRSRLNDLFLDLHLDLRREVAFKRQAVPDGGGRFPTLLFDTAWSREETILMVYLRSRSRAEEASGVTRVYVDREEMIDHVASLRPDHATDQASDVKRAGNAVENLTKAGLLIGPRGADRFEVSPAIDVVLPLERLQELLRWLQEQNTPDGVQHDLDDTAEQAADGVGHDVAEAADEAADQPPAADGADAATEEQL